MSSYSKSTSVYLAMKAKILNGVLPAGSKLPSVTKLAKSFHVSRSTIFTSMDKLEKEGMVVRKKRSGVYVEGNPDIDNAPAGPAILPKDSRAEATAKAISNDIQSGEFRVGNVLPSRKALCFQYHASMVSIVRALQIVEGQGLIHKVGASLVAGPRHSAEISGRKTIRLIGGRRLQNDLPYLKPHRNFLVSFENEIGSWDLSLVQEDDSKASLITQRPLRDQTDGLLGELYMLPAARMRDLIREGTTAVRKGSSRGRLPLVVFSTSTVIFDAPEFRAKPFDPLYILGCKDEGAGADIARYLAALGHRQIAFFSHTNESWDRKRFSGLEKGLAISLGERGKATLMAADPRQQILQRVMAIRSKENLDKMERAVSGIFDGYQFRHLRPFRRLTEEAFRAVAMDEETEDMDPLFERALQEKSITAWVCSDPIVTLMASDFLAKKGLQVPRDMSLIGIDNYNLLCSIRGINMYDFQTERMGYLAAHCLLGDIPIKKNKQGVVECSGRIVERGSVKRNGERARMEQA